MPEEIVPIKIEIKKIPPNVAIKRTPRNAHPSSPPIVPESNVAIKLCQDPSMKPNFSASGSGVLFIPNTKIRSPKINTINKEIMASHLITPAGPADIVFSK